MFRKFEVTRLLLIVGVFAGPIAFQNCAADYGFMGPDGSNIATSCGTASCSTTPLTKKPTVTTILLALGDQANSKLVANPVSTRFIAETVVRYSSPKVAPKILIVRAKDHHGEDPEDTAYIQQLLVAYQTALIDEPSTGLLPSDVEQYDLIWFHNPGYPMSIKQTYDTLLNFPGAVVLQGDDLTQGIGFSMEPLTGLKFIDNGTSIVCGGTTIPTNDNAGEQFTVSLDPERVIGVDQEAISFQYGNDIDNNVVVNPEVEVIATAIGSNKKCKGSKPRPTITRREKPEIVVAQ